MEKIPDSTPTMTLDAFVIEARRLRTELATAERVFMEFLLSVELKPSIWDGTGKTFVEVLVHHHLCRPERYLKFKRVVHGIGLDAVQNVGFEATVAAGSVKPQLQAAVIEEAKIWEGSNGTAISEESAKSLVRDIKQRDAAKRSGHKSYTELLAENGRLRAEVDKLREENQVLRVELKQYRRGKRAA